MLSSVCSQRALSFTTSDLSVRQHDIRRNIMGFLGSMLGRRSDPAEEILRFDETIRLHQDQLFGITLYFQGIELMYSDQPEILEMNRQSFHNIKDRAEKAIAEAEVLLQQAREDSSKINKLRRFTFQPISGNPMLNQITQRARILVRTYERMFPGRSRSQLLSQDELTILMQEASDQL